MEALQNRFDSFAKQKRVKNPSKPSSYVNAKWPHSSHFLARPDTLAEAGFYFNPSFEDRDNVTCFMCNKQLSEWEETDDPFDIHWEKCGNKCCWASVRCGLKDDIDEHGRFISTDKTRLPTSKQMERLRLQTYAAGEGWIHDQDRNHGGTSQKMARAGFVYTPQHPGDDLATCLYCNVSLSGWDAEDDPLEEHRKREKKNGNSCPFFSSTTTTAEASKPPSRTQSQSKPPSKSQPQKPARSVSKSHKDFVLPTKTYDGELNTTSHDESDTPAALTSSTKGKKKDRSTSASRASRASSTAKTSRRQTRSHSQSRGGLKLGDVVEDEEDEEGEEKVPTRRSRRPTTIAASVMATPGIPKSRSRSVSRTKSKTVEEDVLDEEEEEEEEAEVVAMPAKTPSRSRLKAKVVRDEEEVAEEEEVELKKSTRARPKAKAKPKPKAAPSEPEPEPELDIGVELAVEEEEQPTAKIKSKPATGRKPSRTKSKPPPAPSPPQSEEEEEIEIPAPIPAPVKKAGATSSSIASMRPKVDTSKAPSSSSQTLPKINTKVQDIEAETKHRDFMLQRPAAVTDMDEMDAFALTSESLTPPDQQQTVLAPLHIPKRGGKLKEVNKGIKELNSVEGSETLKQEKKPAPVDVQGTVQLVTQPLSQASVQEKTKAKGKVLDKDKERKSSIMKVVEISTDEEGDDDGGDNDTMDVDLGLKSEKGRGKVQTEKENISNRHTKGTEKIKVVAQPPTVSKPTSSNKPVVKEKQQMEGMVQPAKATTVEKSLRPPTSPSLRFAEPAEDDIEMAEVENELGSEAGHLPDEPTQQSETTTDVLPQTPPRRGPSSAKPQLQPPSEALAGPTHPTLTFPALSKLPFTPLENLTDAELDMTVEEWIRYQMGVEFDKFRRDGERELQRWVGRAREARAIIEAL